MKKIINSEYARNILILYMDYGAQHFTAASINDIISTVIFLELIKAYNRIYKIDILNMYLPSLISTGSSTRFQSTKLLPELSFFLSILQ